MAANPIRIVIADDHTLFREGLRRIFSLEPGFLVVGEAATGEETITVVQKTRPDILLLDLKMPYNTIGATLLKVGEKSPHTRVMILTAYSEDVEDVLDSAKAHARGYVLKGVGASTLVEAVKKVHAGEIWVDEDLPTADDFRKIARAQNSAPILPANESLDALTKRELEILRLVSEGLSNEEIGKKVFISPKTVKTHLTRIFDKLEVKNRFRAALLIMRGSTQHGTDEC